MSNNLLDYTGKTVLITGAATGIGRATALAFAEQGANLVIGDLNNQAEDTVAAAVEKGAKAIFVKPD